MYGGISITDCYAVREDVVLKKYGKALLNALFIAVLMGLTLYFLLKDQELPQIFAAIGQAKLGYLLVGIVFVIAFVCSESVIINYMMRTLKYKAPMKNCIKYSFIGFFFSCVTPSASGGQPAQVYYMSKDGLDISVSSLVLMVITVAYKAVLLILSGLAFLTESDFIHSHLGNVRYILIYGVIVNVAFITFLLVVIFKTSLVRRFCAWAVHLLARMKVVKNEQERLDKIFISLDRYHEGAMYLKSHLMVLFNVLVITIVQRVLLFVVTWLVFKSFGLTGTSIWQIVALQTIISLSVDMLPLPGGIGASEASFMVMFERIFGEKLVLPGMLLSRGISYYVLVLISGLVTCWAHISSQRGERKNK